MKKFVSAILTAAMVSAMVTLPVNAADTDKATETISYSYSYGDAKTYSREMEKLNRGLVAIRTTDGVYLSWRLFDSEDARFGSAEKNVSFNIYRNGSKIDNVADTTNYTDTTAGTSYSVAPVINGVEGEKCDAVQAIANNYFDIPLTKPANETIYDTSGNVSATYSFFPADCSTGDLDGDGEYEIIVKWTSSERDVGSPGDAPVYSGTVHLAAYKLDGTKMWQNDIELGKNVFSSAHTVQFTVYDFDGDGKAEMMCQTSLGSKDAAGNYVSKAADPDTDIYAITDEENATTDYRNGWVINTGREFLTVFNGETGAAIDTIDLPTSRGTALGVDYGDDSGNRSNRFLSNVAYLDGEKPYAVYMRGYYFGKNGRQRTSIAGISFDGERLSPDYRFDTKSGQPGYYEGAYQYVGQGNHNCTVADVDNDGKDEFITGALCMEVNDENQFRPKWCTYLQHGDALHIGDYDPTHKGLEFFTVHEDSGTNSLSGTDITMDFGMSVIDAATGEIMFHESNDNDTGRGMMANVGAGGYYQISSHAQSSNAPAGATKFDAGPYKAMGNGVFTFDNSVNLSQNFRIFWDGDLYDELLDGTSVTGWNGSKMTSLFSASGCVKINGTKSNPALQADLFGDWREELVYPTTDGNYLRVFTTTTPTDYKIKTLMHDPVYRSGVAAEQTAYNQPPHVGFYMDEDSFAGEVTDLTITSLPNKTTYVLGEALDTTGLAVSVSYDTGLTKEITSYQISGYNPNKSGSQTITVSYKGISKTFDVYVKTLTGIEITSAPDKTEYTLGDELDLTGIVVSALYDNGDTEILSKSDYTVFGFDKYAAGEQSVTIDYKGYTDVFTTNTPVEFTLDDDGYITGYTGSNTIVVCPSSINGVTVRGFEYQSLTSSSITKMYFYHEPIYFTGLNNVFPSDMTVVCYKNSTVHEYAVKFNMNVEFLEINQSYADITVEESGYAGYNDGDAIVYQHDKQAWTTTISPVTYGVGARSNHDGGDGYTGIYKQSDGAGNNYLEAKAGQFSTINRHSYIFFDNADNLEGKGQYCLSFDFCIPANTAGMTLAVTSDISFANGRGDFNTDEKTIYAIQNGKDGVEADTWYHYELNYENGEYSQTITNKTTNISVSPAVNTPTNVKAICFPSNGTSRGTSVSAYMDNISLSSEMYSDLTVTVTDSYGALVEDATVTIDGFDPVTTDENGQATFTNIPGGAYTATASYGNMNDVTQHFLVLDKSAKIIMSFAEKVEFLATLTVTVTSKNNLIVPGASVQILSTSDDNTHTQTISTDQNGQAVFENVPCGNYSILVDYSDWQQISSSVSIIKKTSTANVQMSDAFTYRPLSIDATNIKFELADTEGVRVFAAKYDENQLLSKIIQIKKLSVGENTSKIASIGFVPDKLFIWDANITPLSTVTEFPHE